MEKLSRSERLDIFEKVCSSIYLKYKAEFSKTELVMCDVDNALGCGYVLGIVSKEDHELIALLKDWAGGGKMRRGY